MYGIISLLNLKPAMDIGEKMVDNYHGFTEMYNKKTCEVVRVYNFTVDVTGAIVAVVFSNNLAAKNNGYGWQKVKASVLVPVDCVNSNGEFVSKTKRNAIKSMLKLNKAEWVCTDGTVFESNSCDGHSGLELAIEHQSSIVDC